MTQHECVKRPRQSVRRTIPAYRHKRGPHTLTRTTSSNSCQQAYLESSKLWRTLSSCHNISIKLPNLHSVTGTYSYHLQYLQFILLSPYVSFSILLTPDKHRLIHHLHYTSIPSSLTITICNYHHPSASSISIIHRLSSAIRNHFHSHLQPSTSTILHASLLIFRHH